VPPTSLFLKTQDWSEIQTMDAVNRRFYEAND
jgi:hypothetical protein